MKNEDYLIDQSERHDGMSEDFDLAGPIARNLLLILAGTLLGGFVIAVLVVKLIQWLL